MRSSKSGSPRKTKNSGQDVGRLIEHYYAEGQTDGLPVVPPTRASIDAMLAGGGFSAEDELAGFAPQNKTVTAEKAAINAVMAGCLPEHMPWVAAALRAFCNPAFNGIGPATTTASTAMTMIANGPSLETLEINAHDGALGHGYRGNATIGRALRLMLMNVFNIRPGRNDRSTLGNPGRYSCFFGENETLNPWEPLHVERGFAPGQNALTLFATTGFINIRTADDARPEPSLLLIADAMALLGSHNIMGQGELLVVLGNETAGRCHRAGWSKIEVKSFLYQHARRTLAELKRAGRMQGPEAVGDEETWRHVVEKPENIILVVAGGEVGHHAACLHGWGLENPPRSVTEPVEA
jgi:hypothetical protein